jgi:hypothetical protein
LSLSRDAEVKEKVLLDFWRLMIIRNDEERYTQTRGGMVI